MKLFLLKIFTVIVIFSFTTAAKLSEERLLNQTQDLWGELRRLASIKVGSQDARSYRAVSPTSTENSYNAQCPGTVVTLSGGESTIVESHKNYGKDPYPSDYKVYYTETYYKSLRSTNPKLLVLKL